MPVNPGPLVTPDEVLDFLRERHPKVLAAIEAEAREQYAEAMAVGEAAIRKDERERIVRAVEGLSRYESMTPEWYAACVAVLAIVREVEGAEMCPNCVTPWKCNGPHAIVRGEQP